MSEGGLRAAAALLRQRNFACFAWGRLLSVLAWQMMGIALQWQVYQRTHDLWALGLVGLAEFLPFFALVLPGGHVSDHHDRRRIVQWTYGLETVFVALLWWLVAAGTARTWPLYVAIGCFGATRAFWSPATQAVLPALVARAEFTGATAIISLFFQISVVAGPAVAGLLFAVGGAGSVLALCLALFATTWILSLFIRSVPQQTASGEASAWRKFTEGLRYLRVNRIVLGCISLDLFAVLFGGAVGLLPYFADQVLHAGSAGLSLLRVAPAIGAAVVGLALALRPIREHAGLWLFGGVSVFGLTTVAFGLSTSLWFSLTMLALGGAGDMISVYIRAVLVQLNTPDELRGRVGAINSMFIGASNELGVAESGLTGRWFGAVPAVVAGGVATVAVVIGWLRWFPELRRWRRLG